MRINNDMYILHVKRYTIKTYSKLEMWCNTWLYIRAECLRELYLRTLSGQLVRSVNRTDQFSFLGFFKIWLSENKTQSTVSQKKLTIQLTDNFGLVFSLNRNKQYTIYNITTPHHHSSLFSLYRIKRPIKVDRLYQTKMEHPRVMVSLYIYITI
jgi:hypothetical protein